MHSFKVRKNNFIYNTWRLFSLIIALGLLVLLTYSTLHYLKINTLWYLKHFNFRFLNIPMFKIPYIKPAVLLYHLLITYLFISFVLLIFLLLKNPRRYEIPDNYGSSRLATLKDIKRFNPSVLDNEGMCLGIYKGKLLKMNQSLSGMVVAPAGTGKSVSVIIPNILSCTKDSLVINDPKGELYEATSAARERVGNVYKFAWDNPLNSSKWNMLDLDNIPSDQAGRERIAKVIADTIIGSDSSGNGKFWEQSAKDFLFGIILFTIYKKEMESTSSSMPYVYEFLSTLANDPEPYNPFTELNLEEKQIENLNRLKGEGKALLLHAYFAKKHNFPKSVYNQLSSTSSQAQETMANIKATILPKIFIFGEKSVIDNTSTNEFKFSQLRGESINGELRPITVYFVIPGLDQEIYGVISALFVDLATRFLATKVPNSNEKHIRFILDEVAFFPPLQNIINAPALVRGYKISYIYACQDFDQIVKKWGRENLSILLTNTAWKIIFSQNNPNTAKMLSDMLGKTTRYKSRDKEKFNSSLNASPKYHGKNLISETLEDIAYGFQKNLKFIKKHKETEGVPLFEPASLGSLKVGEQILVIQNAMNRPVFCKAAYYLKVPEFKKLMQDTEKA